MIWEISVAVIAFAFFLLCTFFIWTLINVNKFLEDFRHYLNCFEPLFQSLNHLGQVAEKKTQYFKDRTVRSIELEEVTEKEIEESPDLLELAALTLSLWQKYHKRSGKYGS